MSGMHLMSHAYTTTNTRKRKAKNKTKRLKAAEVEHEKFLQKMGVSDSQLKEKLYDEYGKRKHFAKLPDYSEHQATATLSNHVAGNGAAKERNVYSGERQLLGVATMHKSNMVPIFADKKEDAKDIAAMRRG
jgi:hypothetical protein